MFQAWRKQQESNIPRNEYVIHRKPKKKIKLPPLPVKKFYDPSRWPSPALQSPVVSRWSPLDCGAGNDPDAVPWKP
jgi:hypothetical protein